MMWAVQLAGLDSNRYLEAPTLLEAAQNARAIWPNYELLAVARVSNRDSYDTNFQRVR